MPILQNTRHEKFAQLVASGKSADEAYQEAGYKRARQNAHRMMTNDDITSRIAELQNKAAEKHEITRDKITEMLLKDWKAAHECKQIGAARAASESLGRLHGFYIEKRDDNVTFKDVTDKPMTADEWETAYASDERTDRMGVAPTSRPTESTH